MSLNLLLLPFLARFLSGDELGLWYVFASIGSIATLFDFGFNPTIARNIAYIWSGAQHVSKDGKETGAGGPGEPNFLLLKNMCVTCRILYLLIAIVALLLIGTIGTTYIVSVSAGISGARVTSAWAVYLAAIFFNLYFGYYATLLIGVGAVKKYNQIMTCARMLQLCLSIVLLIIDAGILAPAVGYFVYGTTLRALSRKSFLRYRGIGEELRKIPYGRGVLHESFNLFLTIWHNAWRDGLVGVSTYLSSQVTVIISTSFLTLEQTGIYSIAIQLVTALSTLSGVGYTASQPAIQSSYMMDDTMEMRRLLGKSLTTMLAFFILGSLALVTLGVPVLSIIKPGSVFDTSVVLYLCVYHCLYRYQLICSSFISNTNQVPYVWAYLVTGIAGTILCYVLCARFNLGVWGLLVGQSIVQIYNIVVWPTRAARIVHVRQIDLLKCGIEEILCNLKRLLGKLTSSEKR